MKNYFLPMLLSLFFLGACDKNDEIIPEDADENPYSVFPVLSLYFPVLYLFYRTVTYKTISIAFHTHR